MPATGTSLLASATTHRKLMSPKVLNPDDGAAFLAIVRELYDVDQQIETLAGERTDGIAGDGALRDRIHKAQRRHLELRERAEAFRERGELVEVNIDTVVDDYPQAAERLVIGLVENLARLIAREHHEAEERARRRSEEHTSELQSLMRISYD